MFDFRRFFHFYINASIHVALAVASLYWVSVGRLNITMNWYLMGFLFCATIVCYNFVKYGVEAEKYLIVAKPAHRPIQWLSFLAFGLGLFFMYRLKPILWVYIGIFTLISGLYAIPFLPHSKNLRSLGGLKIFLVALVWAGFTLILPAIDGGLTIGEVLFPRAVQRFLLVLILILPFEIRDLRYDRKELKTIPQRFGTPRTKVIGYILITIYFFLDFFNNDFGVESFIFLIVLVIILIWAIARSKQEQSAYYASFWVEGIPIIWALSVELLKIGS